MAKITSGPAAGFDPDTSTASGANQPAAATPSSSVIKSGPAAGFDPNAAPPNAKPDAVSAAQADLNKGPSDASGYWLQRAMSTGTLGASDWLGAGVNQIARSTGLDPNAPTHADIVRQNQEYGQVHPVYALGADLAGYTAGAGKLGAGARLAEGMGGGLLARAAGYGLENAGASALSEEAATGGQASTGDLLKHAVIAGTVGAATGAIPGRGALVGKGSPTEDLGAETAKAFTPLEQTLYNPNDISSAFSAIKPTLAVKQAGGISDSLDTQINKISRAISDAQKAGKPVTADDLTNFQIDIHAASQGGKDIGIAKTYDAALDDMMANINPTSSPLPFKQAISTQSDMAREASLQKNVSRDIDSWIEKAQRNPSGTQDSINKALDNNPQFYSGGVGDMLRRAATPTVWDKAKGAMTGAAMGAAIDAGQDYLTGGNPYLGAIMGAGIGAGAGHYAGKPGAGSLVGKLKVAREFNASGNKVNPSAFSKGVPVVGPMAAYAADKFGLSSTGLGVGVSNLFNPQ